MGRSLDILLKGDWFLAEGPISVGQSGYPIYYRFVVCRALMCFIARHPDQASSIPQILAECVNAISTGSDFEREDFLEVRPFKDDKGFSVIDQTDGCYPLTLYPDRDDKQNHKERVTAFVMSLEDIRSRWNELLPLLSGKRRDDWNEELQERVGRLFKPPLSIQNPSLTSNSSNV